MADMESLYDELRRKKESLEELVLKIVAAKRARVGRVVPSAQNGIPVAGEDSKGVPQDATALRSSQDHRASVATLATEASVLVLELRQLNRALLMAEEAVKAETEELKAPLEATTMALNNLQYERSHYAKAIRACRDFNTKYPGIDLVPFAEFLQNAPEHLTRQLALESVAGSEAAGPGKGTPMESDRVGPTLGPRSTREKLGKDSMLTMIPRLHYELLQRERLAAQRRELEMRKRTLQESISSRKKFLSGLPAQLKVLKTAAQPLQQHLQVLHSARQKQMRRAALLPLPLYIVYTQLLALQGPYGDAPAPSDVVLEGSLRDAEILGKKDAHRGEETREEDAANTAEEEEGGGRRRRKGTASNEEQALQSTGPGRAGAEQASASTLSKDVHAAHPLSVVLSLYDEPPTGPEAAAPDGAVGPTGPRSRGSPLVTMRFRYLVRLRVVTAEAVGEGNVEFLTSLFPGDTGRQWPNAATREMAEPLVTQLAERRDRPYLWCQHLGGLDFLPDIPASLQPGTAGVGPAVARGVDEYRKQRRAAAVVSLLRRRRASEDALKEQLKNLSSLRVPTSTVPPTPWPQDLNAVPVCQLASWSQVDILVAGDDDSLAVNSAAALEAAAPPPDDPLHMDLDPSLGALRALLRADGLSPAAGRALVHRWLTACGAVQGSWELCGVRAFRGSLKWEGRMKGGSTPQTVDMGVLVAIFSDYPSAPPFFGLQVTGGSFPRHIQVPEAPAGCITPWGGTRSGAQGGAFQALHPLLQPESVMGLQQEVNLSLLGPVSSNALGMNVLSMQLLHAMLLFDQLCQSAVA